jgi:TIR domain
MDFIGWSGMVLQTVIETVQSSPQNRLMGVSEEHLARELFGEERRVESGFWESTQHLGMLSALDGLEAIGLLEKHGKPSFYRPTSAGREAAKDPVQLWKQICQSVELTDDQKQLLQAINLLSPKSDDDHAWIEDVENEPLLSQLNWDKGREGTSLLWAVSQELEKLGFIRRITYAGGKMYLTSTYRGLIWEFKRDMLRKCDVFISHITEEKGIADKLKSFLIEAFGQDFKIFVSSDYKSIGGGKIWYSEIIESLIAAPVVLVLLSEASVERRWINFEAGVGIGAGSLVIPLVGEGFPKSKVGLPLSQLQVRALNDWKDVDGVLADIAERTQREASTVDTEAFTKGTSALEGPKLHAVINHVPDGTQEQRIIIGLVNDSPATLTDYRIELEVPNSFLNQNTGRSAEVENRRTNDYRFFRMMSKDSSQGPLYPGDRAPRFYSVNILSAAAGESSNKKVKLSVFSGEVLTQKIEMSLREILDMPPSFG